MPVINPPIAVNTLPTNPLLSGIAEYKENPLFSSIAEPKENPLLSSITEPYKKPEKKIDNKQFTKPLNFFDEMKQAIFKKAEGETLTVHKFKKKSKPIESDSLQTNTLSEKIQPTESMIEKAMSSRRDRIKDDDDYDDDADNVWNDAGSYNTNVLVPVAKKINGVPISVDDAKAIATNPTEANRMVKENTKINKEKAYEDYKELGGVLPLTKDLGIKTINKNIEAINERLKLLNDNGTTNENLKDFLQKNNIKGISKLNKEQLIDRVKSLIF